MTNNSKKKKQQQQEKKKNNITTPTTTTAAVATTTTADIATATDHRVEEDTKISSYNNNDNNNNKNQPSTTTIQIPTLQQFSSPPKYKQTAVTLDEKFAQFEKKSNRTKAPSRTTMSLGGDQGRCLSGRLIRSGGGGGVSNRWLNRNTTTSSSSTVVVPQNTSKKVAIDHSKQQQQQQPQPTIINSSLLSTVSLETTKTNTLTVPTTTKTNYDNHNIEHTLSSPSSLRLGDNRISTSSSRFSNKQVPQQKIPDNLCEGKKKFSPSSFSLSCSTSTATDYSYLPKKHTLNKIKTKTASTMMNNDNLTAAASSSIEISNDNIGTSSKTDEDDNVVAKAASSQKHSDNNNDNNTGNNNIITSLSSSSSPTRRRRDAATTKAKWLGGIRAVAEPNTTVPPTIKSTAVSSRFSFRNHRKDVPFDEEVVEKGDEESAATAKNNTTANTASPSMVISPIRRRRITAATRNINRTSNVHHSKGKECNNEDEIEPASEAKSVAFSITPSPIITNACIVSNTTGPANKNKNKNYPWMSRKSQKGGDDGVNKTNDVASSSTTTAKRNNIRIKKKRTSVSDRWLNRNEEGNDELKPEGTISSSSAANSVLMAGNSQQQYHYKMEQPSLTTSYNKKVRYSSEKNLDNNGGSSISSSGKDNRRSKKEKELYSKTDDNLMNNVVSEVADILGDYDPTAMNEEQAKNKRETSTLKVGRFFTLVKDVNSNIGILKGENEGKEISASQQQNTIVAGAVTVGEEEQDLQLNVSHSFESTQQTAKSNTSSNFMRRVRETHAQRQSKIRRRRLERRLRHCGGASVRSETTTDDNASIISDTQSMVAAGVKSGRKDRRGRSIRKPGTKTTTTSCQKEGINSTPRRGNSTNSTTAQTPPSQIGTDTQSKTELGGIQSPPRIQRETPHQDTVMKTSPEGANLQYLPFEIGAASAISPVPVPPPPPSTRSSYSTLVNRAEKKLQRRRGYEDDDDYDQQLSGATQQQPNTIGDHGDDKEKEEERINIDPATTISQEKQQMGERNRQIPPTRYDWDGDSPARINESNSGTSNNNNGGSPTLTPSRKALADKYNSSSRFIEKSTNNDFGGPSSVCSNHTNTKSVMSYASSENQVSASASYNTYDSTTDHSDNGQQQWHDTNRSSSIKNSPSLLGHRATSPQKSSSATTAMRQRNHNRRNKDSSDENGQAAAAPITKVIQNAMKTINIQGITDQVLELRELDYQKLATDLNQGISAASESIHKYVGVSNANNSSKDNIVSKCKNNFQGNDEEVSIEVKYLGNTNNEGSNRRNHREKEKSNQKQ